MKFFQSVVTLSALVAGVVESASTFSPARPPAIPLAVRNPWLSTWLSAGSDGGNGGLLPGEWTTFWNGKTVGWTGMIKVDGANYLWMGAPKFVKHMTAALATQVSFTYTSTRSTFVINAGSAVQLTIEFLSPVVPSDEMRSSLASSYMNVKVVSLDGANHNVQLYTDISAEWVSGNNGDVAQWSYGLAPLTSTTKRDLADIEERDVEAKQTKTYKTYGTQTAFKVNKPAVATEAVQKYVWQAGDYPSGAPVVRVAKKVSSAAATATAKPGIAYHQVYRQAQNVFGVKKDQALWGNWYYATNNTASLTYQSGQDTVVRNNFLKNGVLPGTSDTNYRAIQKNWPVFGYSVNLGSVGKTAVSTLFTINLMQQQVILYENGYTNSNQSLAGLWTNYFANDAAAVSFAYQDYAAVSAECTTLDNQVQADSIAAAGQNYYAITALAVRQAFGALQLAANGTGNDYYVFLKEISSDGNAQTVDVLFPLSPILVYLNPTWLKLALEPLFVNQESGYWPYQYSIHDLGSNFPTITGHNNGNAEDMPLEESGDMIIMALAYAQRANDNAWLSSHYAILRQWNQYLIEEALIPQRQISTDDFAGALVNQTNLALKGIIGIAAMAEIATRTGNTADASNYTSIALSYISQWQTLATTTTKPYHTMLNYNNPTTWGLLYNLYADRLLNLGLVPQSVYDMQSAFYPTVFNKNGVPLDTRHVYTKLDWEMWVAAIASNSTQTLFHNTIANWINTSPTNNPLTDLYKSDTGDYAPNFPFTNRPVVGGLFALLALDSAPSTPFLQNGS